jgi:hypothetical protein
MSGTQWLPGILVLSAGLVAAGLYLLVGRRRAAVPPAEVESDAQLHLDSLLRQAREHQGERHQMEPSAWAAEQERLEHLAAAAMRALEGAVPAAGEGGARAAPQPRPGPASGSSFFGRHPQLSGAIWGGGLVLFFGGLGLWLSQEQKPRTADEGATGTVGRGEEAPPGGDSTADPDFQEALGRARDQPGASLEMTGQVVRELIRREEFQQAAELTDGALAVDPFRTESRVQRAFLQAVLRDRQAGLRELGRLARLYPRGSEALLFSGMIHMQAQENREALDDLEGYLAATPPSEVPQQLRDGVAALRRQVTGAP